MKRGELWWVDFPGVTGSEPAKRRPAVVVQSDVFNQSSIATVLVAPLTSNTRLGELPGNLMLRRGRSPLDRDSVINVSQLSVVDRRRLSDQIGTLTVQQIEQLDTGLRLVLDLDA